MPVKLIREFLRLEAAGGILLVIMAVLALLCSNSGLSPYYDQFLRATIELHFGDFRFNSQPLLFWVNDGLMAVFFLFVGLELKRAFLEGELSGVGKIILPGVAALGGMVMPGLLYVAFNYQDPIAVKGWSIPIATDIAFALGVLSLFSKRVPMALKLFLMALAIFDDMGGILIIAIFYSHGFSFLYLCFSILLVIALFLCHQRFKIRRLFPYLFLGGLLWLTVLSSGIHPTVAGVVLALLIPLKKTPLEKTSPLQYLEKKLHPWVVYLILPLFAFANAGLSLQGLTWHALFDTMVLGIVLGLFVGKQIGVFLFSALIIKLGFAKLPHRSSWLELYGVSLLCGIGFTMSLFLGTLAFQSSDPIYLTEVRLGVLLGSVISGLTGAIILNIALIKKRKGGLPLEK